MKKSISQMDRDLKLGGYAEKTRKVYVSYAKRFGLHIKKPFDKTGSDEIRQYLLHLIEVEGVSRESFDQARAALIFLYGTTLKRPIEVEGLPVPRRSTRLPVVLSGTEVHSLLMAVENPMYRTVMMALYAAGLRISEACQLRPEDIDSKRMVIHVRAGKGNKDRVTILSERLLLAMRDYWRKYRPRISNEWIFPGQYRKDHISPAAVRNVFDAAVKTAGIRKAVTPHTLRHCFATHLLEMGVDIAVIQALLGHSSLDATQVYTHISLEHIGGLKSPFDVLGTPAAVKLR